MPSLRLAVFSALIAAFGVHSAYALEVTDGGSNSAAANLTDPDDKIPVSHFDDDNKLQQPSGFKFQASGANSSQNGNRSLFDRAVDNSSNY